MRILDVILATSGGMNQWQRGLKQQSARYLDINSQNLTPLKTENIKELTKIVDRGEGPKSQSQREQRKGEDQGTARDSYDPSPQLSNIPDDRVHVFPRNIGDWQTEEGMHVS